MKNECYDLIKQKVIEIKNQLTGSDKIGIYNGDAGALLFFAYLKSYLNTNDYDEKINFLTTNVFKCIDPNYTNLTFGTGLSGSLWTVLHLIENQFIDADIDLNDINSLLKNSVSVFTDNSNFDFIHGSDGIVFYLLSADIINKKELTTFVNTLNQNAVKQSEGVYWKDQWANEEHKPIVNFGLAHGIVSKIILLNQILKKYPSLQIADELLKNIITTVLKFKSQKLTRSLFPSYSTENGLFSPSRLAWCYGDLGIASAFWQVGNSMNLSSLKAEAIEIMLYNAKRRDLKENGISDAGICHGTAGIAHIYNRFYKQTGIKEFDDARWYWINETLKLANQKDGLAGFKTWKGGHGWHNDTGLLEGIAGIGLVFLGFLTEDIKDLNWDECLLLS